ncbi:YHYH protein [Pseudoalteromonas rubra]|uniref:PEBP family protein n=1 Tax=Pseudoalteromonas rubra TaxID=43658 RepID=A0A5S3WZH8_9GAMM|nr:YHYH protein [Pseudoalteromonas rubra]TMP37332.1 PEBP family protein [Pseudoalteromonas rubra]
MKQLLLITLCTVLCACGSGSDSATTDQTNVTSDTDNNAQDNSGNSSGDTNQDTSQSSTFVLSSPAFAHQAALPVSYTCDGDNLSPPLSWQGAPEATQEFALSMETSTQTLHWLVYHIDNDVQAIVAGDSSGVLGNNSVNGEQAYAPPCPESPGTHYYTFTLYALSERPSLDQNAVVDRATFMAAINPLTLNSTALTVSVNRFPDVALSACEQVQLSVSNAGFSDVAVTCDSDYAYVTSDTYPDHDLMNGITGTNEQIPVPAPGYAAPIRLDRQLSSTPTSIDAALGVAVNGVPIYDYSAQGELDLYQYDPAVDTKALGQLDNCGGHAGRGDDYHYHAAPTCMIAAMTNQGDDAILGWGYDGYPLYGNNNPDGSAIASGTLDLCNGQSDSEYGYRYHTSEQAPYVFQCLMGEVNTQILPRVAPMTGDNPQMRANLTPPQGGVSNLTHTILSDGTRSMTYTHQGTQYYVNYTPITDQDNCYQFEQKTVSNGGIVETGTFCR